MGLSSGFGTHSFKGAAFLSLFSFILAAFPGPALLWVGHHGRLGCMQRGQVVGSESRFSRALNGLTAVAGGSSATGIAGIASKVKAEFGRFQIGSGAFGGNIGDSSSIGQSLAGVLIVILQISSGWLLGHSTGHRAEEEEEEEEEKLKGTVSWVPQLVKKSR